MSTTPTIDAIDVQLPEKQRWLDEPVAVPMPVEPPPVPLFEDEPKDLTDIISIDKAFRAIRYYEDLATNKKLERDLLLQNYTEFYAKKIEYCEKRIEAHRASIAAYLTSVEKNSISTPSGGAHFRTVQKTVWPADDVMLAWAKAASAASATPLNLIRTKEEVAHKAATAYMKETGDMPPGLEVVPVTTLVTQ